MILYEIAKYSVTLPLIIAGLLLGLKYKLNAFSIFIVGNFIFQSLIFFIRDLGLENIWFVNTKSIILATILIYYFLQSRIKPKQLLLYIFAVALLGAFANNYLGWHSFNKLTYLSNNIIIVVLAIYDTFQIISNSSQTSIVRLPRFWASFGILFYFSTTTLMFAALDIGILNQNFDVYKLYVSIQPILVIIANLLYSMAFITQWKTKTSLS